MARRQNVRDRIGMAVYEKKKLNKKLVTICVTCINLIPC